MMQALFSQTLRFKAADGSDFPDWVNLKLEDKFSFHKTNSLSRAVLGLESDGIENIHYGDIHTKYRGQFDIRYEITGIIPNHLTDKAGEPLKKGDVIFADASEDYSDVGKAIEVVNLDGREVVAGLHTIVARPQKDTIALGFAAYLFASWPLRKQLMRIANGASVLGISKANLAKVDLTLPSLPEQQKIADALSAIDAKIEALTSRLEATREFKRGLLQKMFV
jgi:type I restriction enzyme S subunit